MPDIAEPPATPPTPQQAQITKATNAAVVDTAFGADFDAEVDAAIARDAGAETVTPKSLVESKPAAPRGDAAAAGLGDTAALREQPKAPEFDIPEALLSKKKAEPKPEVVEAEREKAIKEQTAGMSQKAADRFRAIEAKAHAAEVKAHAAEEKAARTEKLEAQLADTLEKLKHAADPSAMDAYKKQVEELDAIVNKNALTEHPRFRAKFDVPLAQEIATAAKFVAKEVAPEVEALLAMPETAQRNRRLNEIAGELEDLERGKFIKAIDNADRLSSERAVELANWKVNKTRLAEVTEAERAQAAGTQQEKIERALKSVLPRFTDDEKGIELFRKVEGNEDWNKVVETRLENVRKLTATDLSREDTAEMAAWAISGAEYRKLFLTQRVLLTRLQEEIAQLKAGEPSLGTGGVSGGDDDESGSMVDVITRMAVKAGALR